MIGLVDMAASSIPEYEFVGTSKSKSNRSKDGIDLGYLVTHKAMIFWKFACNKSKTKIYYGFSIKRETGCKASAVVDKVEFSKEVSDEVTEIWLPPFRSEYKWKWLQRLRNDI